MNPEQFGESSTWAITQQEESTPIHVDWQVPLGDFCFSQPQTTCQCNGLATDSAPHLRAKPEGTLHVN